MITRADAENSAAAWARAESLLGRPREPLIDEFDLGFIVVMAAPVAPDPAVPTAEVGAGVRVIDRATGRVSTWPNWPLETVQRTYREQRPDIVDPPRTADPEVALRRDAHRRITPGVAAHVTVDGRVYVGRGAKGDQELRHHRLVAQLLGEPAEHERVRGSERHAELIACSDALHDVDRRRGLAGLAPITLDQARVLLRGVPFETFQIQAPGDPLAGKPNDPCETCVHVLTQLALLPWASTGALYEFVAPPRTSPDPARFSDTVAAELLDGGWWPGAPYDVTVSMAQGMLEDDILPVAGLEFRHQAFPAFAQALGHTALAGISRRAPGVSQRSRAFEIQPEKAAHTADLLHEFGRVIGARLLPLGRVGGESVLAIDEHGRIFDLDQAGEWFVADTYLDALETLTLGRRTYRVRDDGTWS